MLLKDEAETLDKKPNYMTVPAAFRELEKIEMIKGFDGWFRPDHIVTKTQKTILKELMDAAEKSGRSYEEIPAFLKTNIQGEEG